MNSCLRLLEFRPEPLKKPKKTRITHEEEIRVGIISKSCKEQTTVTFRIINIRMISTQNFKKT